MTDHDTDQSPDRKAKGRAASAKRRADLRELGLTPHEHWYRPEHAARVAEFIAALELRHDLEQRAAASLRRVDEQIAEALSEAAP